MKKKTLLIKTLPTKTLIKTLSTKTLPTKTLLCGALLLTGLSTTDAHAKSWLRDIKVHSIKEHRLEVGFIVTGWIPANDVDALAKCLPKKDRRLRPKGDVVKDFRGIRWEAKRLVELEQCNLKHCVFNIPKWAIKRVMKGTTDAERKRNYYAVIRDISYGLNKKKRISRIEPHLLSKEPCGNHNLFHWLLNGTPKSWDHIIWRKHFAKKMRPTLKTIQVSRWKVGSFRCIGYSTLFGDHYYYDGLDLLQLFPGGAGKVGFRFHVRERYDVLKEWWARTFRYRLRNMLRGRKVKGLNKRVGRCLGGS